MTSTPRVFDNYLQHINVDRLKSIVRVWGGKSQLNKTACIDLIQESLADPQKVRAVVAGLEPYQRTALALIKLMGGEIEAKALAVGLHASGVKMPSKYTSGYWNSTSEICEALIRRGLVLSGYLYDPTYLSEHFGAAVVFSDERLLAQVGLPEVVPVPLETVAPPPTSSFRRPQTVALDILSILQAIDNQGGLLLTKNGAVRATEQRKLLRAMGWEEDAIGVDGFRFPNPAEAWLSVLSLAGLVTRQGERLMLSELPERFATRPYPEQVALLLHSFVSTGSWNEQWKDRWRSYHDNYYSHARLALKLLLMALPDGGKHWVSVTDLDKALFDRIGAHFSLDYVPSRPYPFSKNPEQLQKEEAEWRARLRIDWLKRERKWMEQALTSWLFYLGIVELGMDSGNLISLRLTGLGRAVLYPGQEEGLDRQIAQAGCPWIVQPNFEVVVYLDRATPGGLAFLEKHAERVQAQQHTAIYRLTRDSVYRGLEGGTPVEDLLEGLRSGSEAELPQNVAVDIREWAALRERVSLHRRGRLLEFDTCADREAALARGVPGTPIGERFLLLPCVPSGKEFPGVAARTVDYRHPLAKCLAVNEGGEIKLKTASPDLLIEAQLARWAEPQPGKVWRLTEKSVSYAVKRGARLGDLLDLLADRLAHSLPRLLRVALQSWAGARAGVEVSKVSLLRCRNADVFQAIASSKMLKPYLLGQLAPDVLLVDTAKLEALKERLAWAGFEVGDILS
jgi:hypothetical protein